VWLMGEKIVQPKEGIDNVIFGEIQLLLAEKRTALSSLRAGIAVFALPLSVLSFLVATSKYYQPLRVLEFLVPLLALNAGLVGLGCYLIVHSILRIRHYDKVIKEIKRQHSAIAEFVDSLEEDPGPETFRFMALVLIRSDYFRLDLSD